jgi:proline iminopeptidase
MSNYTVMVPVKGGKLYCEITDFDCIDDNKQVVFVLAGGPGFSLETYKNNPSINFFSNIAHLVFFDPGNCGKSRGFDNSKCTLNKYIEDIEAVRRHFNFQKITLLGTSYGSMAAVGYAIKYPAHLQGMILVAGAPSYHFIAKAKENLIKKGTPEQIKFCTEIFWPGKFESSDQAKYFFSLMAPLYSNKVRFKNAPSPYKNDSYIYPYELLNVAFSSEFWRFDYTPYLNDISVPTLILSGENDWINDPIFAKQMAKEIPNSQLNIISESGHTISFDAPEEYKSVISNFITNLC